MANREIKVRVLGYKENDAQVQSGEKICNDERACNYGCNYRAPSKNLFWTQYIDVYRYVVLSIKKLPSVQCTYNIWGEYIANKEGRK